MTRETNEERDEARDAAQQFFEAAVCHLQQQRLPVIGYIAAMLEKWSWLRPNPYQGLNQ